MAEWALEFTKAAEHDFRRLNKSTRLRIITKLEWLQDNFERITPTPLHGLFKGFYKLRIGEQRAIYSVDKDIRSIIVHVIDKRDKIYKIK